MSHNVVPIEGSATPRILLSVAPPEREAFFPADTLRALSSAGEVTTIDPSDVLASGDLESIGIAVVAWGFPRLDEHLLARMPHLRLVVNAASSVRSLISDAFWASGIPVSQSGAAMAPAVAEMSLTLTLALLRRTHRMDHVLRTGGTWEQARAFDRARELSGSRIGVIGASRTGREYIRMCRALGADVLVFDPYLSGSDPLAELAAGLDDVLAHSDIVALHAPATAETTGMIGRRELALLPDGSGLVNTARSSLVDMNALYDEASAGRLDAALDVFDEEPLPVAARWRALPNVLLTAHVSGATRQSRARAGQIVVDEIGRFLSGRELRHRVTRDALERMG
ncbi:phosphoglycerate dehydrogenase-like enzyme [Microbacterium sp. ZKA21]|uniref:hydroxyacid dehydrogenase n=1 Tax=Microbacterium sp. ZKA21 TaxID=3381694 RepID=UPI003D23436E